MEKIKLTAYSHGAGCGCKIAPQVLSSILERAGRQLPHPNLLVGNDARDDAAVYAIDEQRVVISTTDFFMPIVDDPKHFGGIASVNAISDVYAMGGSPLMAIAILGWPVDKLAAEVAGEVLEGAREACARAGIPLAGGHSIDAPEPIFGLAVTGLADKKHLRSNDMAREGSLLYLTKPIGIGIMTTAQKRGLLQKEDEQRVIELMLKLNDIGEQLGRLDYVTCMTDVTGFGLMGHLLEMCDGSNVSAEVETKNVPLLKNLEKYVEHKCFPGGTKRNHDSYGSSIAGMTDQQRNILCDPQTSGGLLVAVRAESAAEFETFLRSEGYDLKPFGRLTARQEKTVYVR